MTLEQAINRFLVGFSMKIVDNYTAVCRLMRDNSNSVQTNCEGEQD
jgi:hypothetical protein